MSAPVHETNDNSQDFRRRRPPAGAPPPGSPPPSPPPSSGSGSDHHPPIPDMHRPPGGFHPPPTNHPSWPRPGQFHPGPQPKYYRPRPGQFRPRPLHRPTIAWLPHSNIPSWLCNYVAQFYGFDPMCCQEAFDRGRNIYDFEVENCVMCGHPDC